jgi:peptidoglycan hydrolase-like protein with peptidoglycan-binding domain
MLPGRVKFQLVAFVLLSGGVAANLFLLQPHARGPGGQASGESRMADSESVSLVDTGSISREPGRDVIVTPLAPIKVPHDASDVTRAVQRELQIRGYETGAADGVPGVMTRAAIMGFEYDHGLALTGQPSQDLLKRILLGGGERASKRVGSRGQSAQAQSVIGSVQTSLARLGYKPGPINGRLTPETARAIREFEVDQALPESGRISGPLVARLTRLAGEGKIASGR